MKGNGRYVLEADVTKFAWEPQRNLPGQYSNRIPPQTLPLHKIGRYLVRSYPLIFNFLCISYVLNFVRHVTSYNTVCQNWSFSLSVNSLAVIEPQVSWPYSEVISPRRCCEPVESSPQIHIVISLTFSFHLRLCPLWMPQSNPLDFITVMVHSCFKWDVI